MFRVLRWKQWIRVHFSAAFTCWTSVYCNSSMMWVLANITVLGWLSLLPPVGRWKQVSAFGWIIIINGDGQCRQLAAYRRTYNSSRLAWSEDPQPLGAVRHSSDEPCELPKWLVSWWQRHKQTLITIIVIIISWIGCFLYPPTSEAAAFCKDDVLSYVFGQSVMQLNVYGLYLKLMLTFRCTYIFCLYYSVCLSVCLSACVA